MKILFVGASISWDSLAVALGYLGQPLGSNNWYGNPQIQKKGSALVVGYDHNGNQILAMGSPHPPIIKKVVGEMSKLGCFHMEPVEVVVLDLPGQTLIQRLITMARWSLVGTPVLLIIDQLAQRYAQTWWNKGRLLFEKENLGCRVIQP